MVKVKTVIMDFKQSCIELDGYIAQLRATKGPYSFQVKVGNNTQEYNVLRKYLKEPMNELMNKGILEWFLDYDGKLSVAFIPTKESMENVEVL